jgi:soluble lytic murein transglycosylase
MKVALSPTSVPLLAFGCLAVLLSLMVMLPVEGQSSGGTTAGTADSASARPHKATHKEKKQAKADKKAAKAASEKAAEATTPVGEKATKTAKQSGKKSKKSASQKDNKDTETATPTDEKATKAVSRKSKKASKVETPTDERAAKPESAKGKKATKPASTAAKETREATKPVSQADSEKVTKSAGPTGKKAPKPNSRKGKAASKAIRRAQTAQIKLAFVASAELRPMAQQLAMLRTPAAYAGVTKYAQQHSGEAAAAAYLALGHASLLDKHYTEAVADFHLARQAGEELADYADFLAARANHDAGNDAAAEVLLRDFLERYPESIFAVQAPELEANTLLAMNNAAGAQQVLAAAADTASANRPGYQLAQGQVAFILGKTGEAERIYKQLLLSHPLTPEAEVARAKLIDMGAEARLTTAELRSLGDAYYNAGRYANASEQYRALARQSTLDADSRNSFTVAAAACDLKLKRLTKAQAEALPETQDENGARRLYLLMELARSSNDLDEQKRLVAEMESSFPRSPWLAEALFDSGNMYLLRHEYAQAAVYYGTLATRFPSSKNASAAHWKAGWLSYRQGLYADAARLFDEQIRLYPNTTETAAALYWRGRLYEAQEHNPTQAAANYRTVIRVYQRYFYAQMARRRLLALEAAQTGPQPPTQIASQAQLDRFQPPPVPPLEESFPADSPHLAKARLLANAGLNDYIAQEIAADPDSSSWSALAEAQIYASYGETFRAMRAVKRALPSAATASIKSIPLPYWRILFPEPWWETIKSESAKNNLDPYLVASLIRQESEFNPSAVSRANAFGLMQLLPAVGKEMAREEGISHFETFQLLDPVTNIRLGARDLRKTLDRFGGVTEYALAAYNAGGERVVDWQAAGPYEGMDEFVESIPFTQTREYVESILRNIETYRAIDEFAASQDKAVAGAGR